MATLPATVGGDAPVVGLIAHVDTSPDAPGAGVEPIVHRGYDGGVIELPRDGTRARPASDAASSAARVGHDIVTSSGDTLLGADDKAGVAEIMAAVAHLAAHPELPRPDAAHLLHARRGDRARARRCSTSSASARACAYTMDGSTLGELQDETFTAAEAVVTIHGRRGAPRLRDRQARQRRAAGGADRSPRCLGPPHAGDDVGARGLHPRRTSSAATAGQARDPRDRARLRRRPARRATSSCCAAPPRRSSATRAARARLEFDVADAVPEHAPLPRAVPGGHRARPSGRSAPRASSRSASRSAAAPTARC